MAVVLASMGVAAGPPNLFMVLIDDLGYHNGTI